MDNQSPPCQCIHISMEKHIQTRELVNTNKLSSQHKAAMLVMPMSLLRSTQHIHVTTRLIRSTKWPLLRPNTPTSACSVCCKQHDDTCAGWSMAPTGLCSRSMSRHDDGFMCTLWSSLCRHNISQGCWTMQTVA